MDQDMSNALGLILSKISSLDDKITELEIAFKQEISDLNTKMTTMENTMTSIQIELSDVKELSVRTAVTLETVVQPKIQLIFENQGIIVGHNTRLNGFEDRVEKVEDDVFALKNAFKDLQCG